MNPRDLMPDKELTATLVGLALLAVVALVVLILLSVGEAWIWLSMYNWIILGR
jgi:hypothetical protein